MKMLILALAALFLSESFAHDHPSVHGMLMVGKKTIYLSHLPMFHSPHDYQVILEVQIENKAADIYQKSLKESDEKIYTLVPEVFVLPDMIKNPKPFSAQIYRGHFERGGEVIVDKAVVSISKIIFFKKFNLSEARPVHGSYILFGNEKEKFLAHLISVKPDFDQVLEVETKMDVKDGASLVKITSVKNTDPLLVTSEIDTKIPIVIKNVVYLEKGDLSL